MQERSEAERRAIWPCLNVATWRRERSDRAIQQIWTSSNKPSSMHIGCNSTHFVPFWKSAVLSRFENRLFCLVLKSAVLSRIPATHVLRKALKNLFRNLMIFMGNWEKYFIKLYRHRQEIWGQMIHWKIFENILSSLWKSRKSANLIKFRQIYNF